jgi:hypothetical protein
MRGYVDGLAHPADDPRGIPIRPLPRKPSCRVVSCRAVPCRAVPCRARAPPCRGSRQSIRRRVAGSKRGHGAYKAASIPFLPIEGPLECVQARKRGQPRGAARLGRMMYSSPSIHSFAAGEHRRLPSQVQLPTTPYCQREGTMTIFRDEFAVLHSFPETSQP